MGAASMATSYIRLGEKSKAMKIIDATCNESIEYLKWYESLSSRHKKIVSSDYAMHLGILQMFVDALNEGGEPYKAETSHYKSELGKYYTSWRKRNS